MPRRFRPPVLLLTLTLLTGCPRPAPPRPGPPASLPVRRPTPEQVAASRPTSRPTSLPASLPTTRPVEPPTTLPSPVPTRAVRCGDPRAGPRVALTFDDGPSRFTPKLLDVLRRERVPATFFVLGRLVRRHPALVRRIHAEGHLVANHSFDHPKRASIEAWRRQIQRTEELIRAAGVPVARFFRPPHGVVRPALLRLCHELGYTVVLYTLLSSDWELPGVKALVSQVLHRVAPGSIVVLHDAGGNRQQTLDALPDIIRGLRRKGFALLGPTPRPLPCARPNRPLPPPTFPQD
jgi:peptidoglycan/xylan/chitin deacetylase (PgdA/CDA1 family)